MNFHNFMRLSNSKQKDYILYPKLPWCAEKWSPGKFLFLFLCYQLIPLHTQINIWRLRHDPTYVPNCRTLKESRKICCRVLGFHRSITSEHSTHIPRCSTLTPRFFVSGFGFVSEFCVCCRVLDSHRLITSEHSTHTPRCSTLTPRFFVSEFPGDPFSGGHFSGDHFSGIQVLYR